MEVMEVCHQPTILVLEVLNLHVFLHQQVARSIGDGVIKTFLGDVLLGFLVQLNGLQLVFCEYPSLHWADDLLNRG